MNQGDKAYSRDYTMRGRAKVMLKDGNKKPINPEYPNSKFYFLTTTFNANAQFFSLPIITIMLRDEMEYELISWIYIYIWVMIVWFGFNI